MTLCKFAKKPSSQGSALNRRSHKMRRLVPGRLGLVATVICAVLPTVRGAQRKMPRDVYYAYRGLGCNSRSRPRPRSQNYFWQRCHSQNVRSLKIPEEKSFDDFAGEGEN